MVRSNEVRVVVEKPPEKKPSRPPEEVPSKIRVESISLYVNGSMSEAHVKVGETPRIWAVIHLNRDEVRKVPVGHRIVIKDVVLKWRYVAGLGAPPVETIVRGPRDVTMMSGAGATRHTVVFEGVTFRSPGTYTLWVECDDYAEVR